MEKKLALWRLGLVGILLAATPALGSEDVAPLLERRTPRAAGPNDSTTVPLHVREGFRGCYTGGDPCVIGPNLSLELGQEATVYVLLRHYTEVSAFQCAFEWPQDWLYSYGSYCLPGSNSTLFPEGPGPDRGRMGVAFNCITGGATRAVVYLHFVPTSLGCLRIIEPNAPGGTHVVDCMYGVQDHIPPDHLGSVCVGEGGRNVCDALVPVEPGTWGKMKATYRNRN